MISEGCVHCWAQSMAARLKAIGQKAYDDLTDEQGRWTGTVALLNERLGEPLRVKKPSRIVVNFMGDLFHAGVTDEFIQDVFVTMKEANQHTFFVLTKRPGRAAQFLTNQASDIPALPNVLIGTTVENQKWANERRASMAHISYMGWWTWVSYEPALEMVDWTAWNFLDWMAAGGESGSSSRPMHPDWARAARDFCVKHRIKFYFKQWGSWMPVCPQYGDDDLSWMLMEYVGDHTICLGKSGFWYSEEHGDDEYWCGFQPDPNDNPWFMIQGGKGMAGRVLDGRTWDELPVFPFLWGRA